LLSVDKKIINDSLESGFYDFEDAVQYYTAKSSGIEIIITRNKKDYITEDITVMSADEFLATL
jgi:predicted nucleic acid-binding protein